MTINWDIFYIFTIVSVILWIISAVTSAAKDGISKTAVAASLSGSIVFLAFIIGLWIYLQRPPLRTMGETRLWYSLFMGISGLLEMEIQMDTLLLHFGIDSVLHHQHTQTGDTRPVADACPAKRMVHPSCDCIYVFILSAWMRIHHRMYRNEKA